MLERLLKGTAVYLGHNLVISVLQLATAIVVFRLLDVTSYGQLALALSVSSFGIIFLDMGLRTVVISEIAKRRGEGKIEDVKLFFLRYLQFTTLVGIFMAGAFAVVGQSGWIFHRTLWFFMGLYILTMGLNTVVGDFFYSHTYFGHSIFQSIIRSLLRLVLVLGLLAWPEDRLLAVAATYPLADALSLMVIWPIWVRATSSLRDVPLPQDGWQVLWTTFKEQGVFSSMIVPFKRVRDLAPIWVVSIALGPAAVGLFSAAQRAFSILLSFFQSIEAAVFPLLSEYIERDWASARQMINQSIKYTFWAGMAAVGAGWLLAPWFFGLVAGAAYVEALPLFRWMLLYLLVYAFAQIQRPLFYALGLQRSFFYSYVINAVLSLILLILGVRLLGVIGAVLAWLTSEALIVYLRFLLARQHDRALGLKVWGLFSLSDLDRRTWARIRHRSVRLLGDREGLPFTEN